MIETYFRGREQLYYTTAVNEVTKQFGEEYTYVVPYIHKLDVHSLEDAHACIEAWFDKSATKHYFTFDKDEAFAYPNPNEVQTRIYHSHVANFAYTLPMSDHLG